MNNAPLALTTKRKPRNLFANGIPPLPGEAQQPDTAPRKPRNLFANGIPPLPEREYPEAKSWEPTLLEQFQGLFSPSKERASNERVAREIAARDNASPESVYASAGGHRPIWNPEGRNSALALQQGAGVVAKQVPDILPSIGNTVLRSVRGGRNSAADDSLLDRSITATDIPQDPNADPNYSSLQGLGQSAGYSLTSLGASLGVGIPATAATSPAGGVAAGMAASGTVSFRASKDQFLDNLLKKMTAEKGRLPTEEEWSKASDEANSAANAYGAWEAIPEAIGNAIMLKAVSHGLKGLALEQLSEHTGETATALGQNRAERQAGLTNETLTLPEAWRQQALQTTLITGAMGGAGALGKKAYGAYQNYGENKNQNPDTGNGNPTQPQGETVNIYADEQTGQQPAPSASSGIGNLIASGEGDYGSFNRGNAGDAKGAKIDFSQMTVGELMRRQSLPAGNADRVFAFGKYQIIPSTLEGAVESLGIDPNTPVTPALQEQIFSSYLLDKKRPAISAFIRGEHGDIGKAQLAAAQEWASIADPRTGKSYYSGSGNNAASVSADKIGAALWGARKAYEQAIGEGKTPEQAWTEAVGSSFSGGSYNAPTAPEGFQSNQTTPDTDLQAGMDAGQQTETQLDIQPVDEVQPTEMADIPAVTGEPSRIRSEDGQWHDADYQVVEADALNSTTDQAENQYRDRNRAGLAEQVRGIANDLQYDLVSKSPVMEYGAPVVGRDGSVIAGNGRLSGIQQAYKGEGAADYKARLQADAASLGIDPQQVAGMRNPVLIRRLKNDIKPTAQPADLPLQQVIGQPIPSEQVISNSLPQPYTSPPTMQAQAVGRGVQANAGLGQAGIVGTEAQPAISVADVEQSRGMEPVVSGQGKQLTDGNQQYSEQPAATGNTTENVTAELSRAVGANRIKRLMHLGRLKVVQSASELSGGTANMAGMYDSATDSVTLVADHIPEGGALGVFLHESGEHAGFKSILGNKYQFIVGQFNKLLQEQNPYAVRAVERVPGDTPAEHVDSERLAYLIEDVTNSQDTGTAYNRARAFVRQVIAAVRAWAVQKLPAWIGPKSLSPADIQALAVRAARAWADNSSSKPADSEQMNETRSENGNSEQVKYSIASAIGSALNSPHKARQRDGWLQLGRYVLNNLVIAPHEAIRDIGTPAAQALADLIRRPLSNEKSPETGALDDLNVASYDRQGEFSTKLDDILAPLRGRRGLKKQDMAALVSGLHTGIVPANLADTARKLRSWLDELRDYQLAAGLDFGYVQHYFPRVYDIKKVTNNHKAFTDMLEKNGYSPEVASDIAARIINGDTLPEMQLNTANRLVVGNNNQIGFFQSREKDKEGHAGKSSYQKSRVLDIPYDELAPFMENNLEHILNRYMGNAIKRAEYARKFGPNEEILNKLVADMVDEMETLPSEVKGRLNTQQAVQIAYDVADMQQGAFRNPSTNKLGVAVRTISNMQVMIKLPLAVFSSAPDSVTPYLLSLNTRQWLAAVVRGTGDGVYEGLRAMDKAVTGKHHLKQSDMYRYTEELGINTNAAIQDAIDSLYFAGDSSVDLLSVGVRKFMHLTFQEQVMRLQKVIATRTFLGSVRRWASNADRNTHSARKLKDFGIDPAQASAWAAGGFQNDPMMQFAINRGAIRFSNSAITTPDRSNKSRMLQDKSGLYPLIFQFQSFSNTFGNTIIPEIARQFKLSTKHKDELLPTLKMVTAMIVMMALAFGAQELRDLWKYGEKKPYKDDSKNDPLRRVANSFDRAGFTGMFSKAFEFFSPYKFGYGEQGGARIAGLFGPTVTDLGKFVDAFMIEQASEEAQAKKQAKFIANMTPGANALPYETKQEYMVKPLQKALR